MQKDLVRSYCGGTNKRFNEAVCGNYISGTGECELLEDIFKVIFEKGRCEPEKTFLCKAVEKNLFNHTDFIKPKEHIQPMTFEIRKRMETKKLNKSKKKDIIRLKSYINTSAYNEVIRFLQQDGFLAEKKCGNCLWLVESHAEKHICERKFLDGKNEILNPFYKQKKRPSDRDCKEGFQPFHTTSMDDPDTKLPAYHMPDPENSYRYIIEKLLRKRMKEASTQNKRKKFQRQWTVFRERFISGEDNKDIALKIGVTVRTIERDLEEIVEYSKKNVGKN